MNKFFLAITLIFYTTVSLATADKNLADELATIYRSARKVISDNQVHINNKNIGNKGLQSSKVLRMTKQNYKVAKGKNLDMSTNANAKQAMLDAIVAVMDENQALINKKDKGFKGFLPAVFAREVATKFSKTMQGKISIKLTAPKNYIRNKRNNPDKWENNVIENKFKNPNYPDGKAFFENTTANGKAAFRYILPEYYAQSCLSCHGKPKGALDITGGKKEGGVLNELGGAISLVIFD